MSDDNENGNGLTGRSADYSLQATGESNISGVARFEELQDGTTLITLDLDGTEAGDEHPAHIHANSVVEGGDIEIHLTPVSGSSGMSETEVSSMGSGTPLTYDDLTSYDGHIMVHLSGEELGTVITRGDIGGNALTGQSITYDLLEVEASGVTGTVQFRERNNGNTLAIIQVSGTSGESDYPAHIHNNSVADGGGIVVGFNSVDSSTGHSVTNIRAGQTSENLNYSALLLFDGHVNVHLPDGTVVASGDIGSNSDKEESVNDGGSGGNDSGGNDNGGGYEY